MAVVAREPARCSCWGVRDDALLPPAQEEKHQNAMVGVTTRLHDTERSLTVRIEELGAREREVDQLKTLKVSLQVWAVFALASGARASERVCRADGDPAVRADPVSGGGAGGRGGRRGRRGRRSCKRWGGDGVSGAEARALRRVEWSWSRDEEYAPAHRGGGGGDGAQRRCTRWCTRRLGPSVRDPGVRAQVAAAPAASAGSRSDCVVM